MRLTKQIDLEEFGYDYVLVDEAKQPSANYKLGEYEDIDTDPTHLAKSKQALEIIDDSIEFQFLERKENNQVKYIVRLINFDNPSQCFEWDMEKEKYDLLKEVLL